MSRRVKPRVIGVDPENPSLEAIREAASVVRRGGLVVYPTDTVYGLGANPLDERAVERVYLAKERSFSKPLPVLVASLEDAKRIAVLSERAERLARAFWPGPLTLVLEARPLLPCIVTACRRRVAVRMPNNRIALLLIEESGGLLIGTSANISGYPPPRTAAEAIRQLGGRVDLVLDAGPTRLGSPSTVLDLSEGTPRVLRRGPIREKDIARVLGRGGE